jgi:hypothetical protein
MTNTVNLERKSKILHFLAIYYFFIKTTTLQPSPIQSHDQHAPTSHVIGDDNTTTLFPYFFRTFLRY